MAKYDPDEFFSAERKKKVSADWKDAFDLPDEIPFDTLLKIYGIEKPMRTHADRIRAMSDEELADKFRMLCCPFCWSAPPKEKKRPADWICKWNCRQCWLDWLKRAVEEADG